MLDRPNAPPCDCDVLIAILAAPPCSATDVLVIKFGLPILIAPDSTFTEILFNSSIKRTSIDLRT